MEGNRDLVKIIEGHQKKHNDDIPGRLQFLSYLLDTSLQMTNDQLDQENMRDFKYYRDNNKRYPDEFTYAFTIFEENLRELQEEIISEILNGVLGGD